MNREFLASRQGTLLLVSSEVLLLLGLSRLMEAAPAPLYLGVFWGLATLFYFTNYRVRRWVQREVK